MRYVHHIHAKLTTFTIWNPLWIAWTLWVGYNIELFRKLLFTLVVRTTSQKLGNLFRLWDLFFSFSQFLQLSIQEGLIHLCLEYCSQFWKEEWSQVPPFFFHKVERSLKSFSLSFTFELPSPYIIYNVIWWIISFYRHYSSRSFEVSWLLLFHQWSPQHKMGTF